MVEKKEFPQSGAVQDESIPTSSRQAAPDQDFWADFYERVDRNFKGRGQEGKKPLKIDRIDILPSQRALLQPSTSYEQMVLVIIGTAVVTIGREVILSKAGDNIFIPAKSSASFLNPTPERLQLLCIEPENFGFYLENETGTSVINDVMAERLQIIQDRPGVLDQFGRYKKAFAAAIAAKITEDVEFASHISVFLAHAGYPGLPNVTGRITEDGTKAHQATISSDRASLASLTPPASDFEMDGINNQFVTTDTAETLLPPYAKRLWANRTDKDPNNPSKFIEKYYSSWLPHTLAQQELHDIDYQLYIAYTSRTRKDRHPGERITFAPKKPRKDKLDDAELGRRHREQNAASQKKSRSKTLKMNGPQST